MGKPVITMTRAGMTTLVEVALLKAMWENDALFTEPTVEEGRGYQPTENLEGLLDKAVQAIDFKKKEEWTLAEICRFFQEAENFIERL